MKKSNKKPLNSEHLLKELDAIINSSYDGLFIASGEGIALRVNKAYERITGLDSSALLGKSMQALVDEGYYNESVTLRVMKTLKTVTINQTIRGKRIVLATGSPVFDDEGNLFRVVTNIRDITELTKLQNELQKTEEKYKQYELELSHLRAMQLSDNDIVTRSPKMIGLLELAMKVAYVDSTVLIYGESGTGKELVAKIIHKRGRTDKNPFIKINCAAIPANLLESELFGYEGGAFTNAKKEGKPGLFELANNGTLFLDEIAEMPIVLQAKLLRALQDKEITRVGGTKPIVVNTRIIAATNRNLLDMVKNKKFREDLYYRLMVVPLYLPPLRERKEDVVLLAMSFVDKLNKHFGYNKKLKPDVIDKLIAYSWSGNVRELENVIERMIVTSSNEDITIDLLPEVIYAKKFVPQKGTRLKNAVEQTELYLLEESFKEHQSWQIVAEELGVDRTTIFRKAKKYGLLKDISVQSCKRCKLAQEHKN